MEISEGVESYQLKPRLVAAREIEELDHDAVCRLQVLVSELLLKNELLRRQVRCDAVMFAKVQHLIQKGLSHASTGGDVLGPIFQAYALLARQG